MFFDALKQVCASRPSAISPSKRSLTSPDKLSRASWIDSSGLKSLKRSLGRQVKALKSRVFDALRCFSERHRVAKLRARAVGTLPSGGEKTSECHWQVAAQERHGAQLLSEAELRVQEALATGASAVARAERGGALRRQAAEAFAVGEAERLARVAALGPRDA